MKLYSFFRSGTSHRLRIALNLKGLSPEYVAVDLRTEQHLKDAFKAINPQQLVPALALDDGQVLIQSPAIIEWLEESYPTPALLPVDTLARAKVRALAAIGQGLVPQEQLTHAADGEASPDGDSFNGRRFLQSTPRWLALGVS